VTGRQLRIEFEVGDRVMARDTVVARIEPTDPGFLDVRSQAQAEAAVRAAEAALALSRAQLRRAETELEFARAELERVRRLSRSSISESALDEARRRVESQEAVVDEARAQLRVREFELERAQAQLLPTSTAANRRVGCDCIDVRSPVSGTILKVVRKSEGVVNAGEAMAEIGDPANLEVVVDLLSSDAVRVKAGQRVLIEAWGGEETLEGKVRRIEPFGFTKVSALGIEEQRVNVIIDFTGDPDAWERLGHGYRVEAAIVLWQEDDVLKVPLAALFRDDGKWTVFVERGGVAHRRTVEVGRRNDLEAQISAGLEAGETIVLHPGDRVNDGVLVTPREG
jgi:HlyD family secretion protein